MSEVKRARHRDDRSEAASKRLALITQRQENWHFIFTIANSTFEQCNAGIACCEMVIDHSSQAKKDDDDAIAMPPPSLIKPVKKDLPLIRKRTTTSSFDATKFITRKRK